MASESMGSDFDEGSTICFSPFNEPAAPGDIVIFDFNKKLKKWCFRVIAVSGDEIRIDSGMIERNGRRQGPAHDIIDDFLVKVDKPLPPVFLRDGLKAIDSLTYQFAGSKHYLDNVIESAGINALIRSQNRTINGIVFRKLYKNANASNIPKTRIPQKNDTIAINSDNYLIYQLLLNAGQVDSIKKGFNIKIPLQEELYFLMGDNRISSMDSRFIGLVPASKIYGIVRH